MKMTMYVHKEIYSDGYVLFSADMSEHGYLCLGPVEIEFEIPDVDIRQAQVDALDKQIAKTRQDFEAKLYVLQERRDNLLAIGFDGEAAQ